MRKNAPSLILQPDESLQSTIQLLYDILRPGGYIALSDFEYTAESELFHAKAKHYDVERHGMKRADLESGLKQAGFIDVKVDESFRLAKNCEDGSTREFPFLIVRHLTRTYLTLVPSVKQLEGAKLDVFAGYWCKIDGPDSRNISRIIAHGHYIVSLG